MGWNDRINEDLYCDECEDCENECTEHEQPCDNCHVINCVCDNMYEAWKEQQDEWEL